MKQKRWISILIAFCVVLLGIIPREPVSHAEKAEETGSLALEAETISKAAAEPREDALVREASPADAAGEIVTAGGNRISSAAKIFLSFLLAWLILVLCLYLSLVQCRSYLGVQRKRKEKYSVIRFIHDSDGRKRRFLYSDLTI
ncbi:MAG: hypothetical protein ACSW8K_04830 [bacterium]